MASRDSVAHRSTRAERSETSHTATGDLTHRRRRRSALRGPLRPLASVELVLLRPHLLHELLVGRGQDDLVELSAVVRNQADALDDDVRSEEHTSELQSRLHLVCRLLLEKKNFWSSSQDVCTSNC